MNFMVLSKETNLYGDTSQELRGMKNSISEAVVS